MVERCALSGSDLKIKFRTILITYIITIVKYCIVLYAIKYVPQPNEKKSFLFCAKSCPYKTHV